MYDCIIVGMGCAGMSAGIYAKRAGLNTLMLDETMPGENLAKISVIENYLGFKSITGSELAYQMIEHIKAENVPYKITKVTHISLNDDGTKNVITTKGEFKTKGVIIATGRSQKTLGLDKEIELLGKGISSCALSDANDYAGEDIAVVGGGNSAFEEASYLSRFASKVTIVVRNTITADISARESVNQDNIKIIVGRSAKEFLGDEYIRGVKLDDDTIINCDGVFIYFGSVADTSFIEELDITDENGYILVDSCMKTKYDGIYACGDVIKKEVYQIATAVSDGAVAATCLKRELEK